MFTAWVQQTLQKGILVNGGIFPQYISAFETFFFFRENTSSGRNINPDSLSLSSYSLDTNKPLGDTMYVDRTISVANCQILWPEC